MLMPLLCIKERPEPLAFPEGKESYPLFHQSNCFLSITPYFLFSKTILLSVGLSISSNNILPMDIPWFTTIRSTWSVPSFTYKKVFNCYSTGIMAYSRDR
jgi:hypothetical protein